MIEPTRVPSPIFVAGCGHSGTSLLVRVLGAHSRLCAVPFESQFALKWPELCEASCGFFARCDTLTRGVGKARWVEKTPRHIYRVGEILRYFPEGKVVLMLRDGRDVACSIRDRYGSLEAGVARWMEDNRAGQAFWNHPNVRVVRYEALVEDFERTLRDVFDFIGEPFEEAVMRYHESPLFYFSPHLEKPGKIFGEHHEQYRNWQMNQPLFDGRGKWRSLSEAEKQVIKDRAGEMLVEYGYAADLNW